MQGHGEYREITEADFLGEVNASEKVICHFYHREFYRCKIMDKHLKSLAPRHFTTKFVKLDAENAPFFVAKLAIKTLPCVILFRNGVATDRLVGFHDLGGKDDFPTRTLELFLLKKGMIEEKKRDEEDDDYLEGHLIPTPIEMKATEQLGWIATKTGSRVISTIWKCKSVPDIHGCNSWCICYFVVLLIHHIVCELGL